MQDVLGHDINGRPLMGGDRVVMVNATNPRSIIKNGAVLTVMRDAGKIESPVNGSIFEAFNPEEVPSFFARYASVRKIDDHLPSNESFEELMGKLRDSKDEQTTKPDNASLQDVRNVVEARSLQTQRGVAELLRPKMG